MGQFLAERYVRIPGLVGYDVGIRPTKTKKFEEDRHPRDDHWRWTSGSGSIGAKTEADSTEAKVDRQSVVESRKDAKFTPAKTIKEAKAFVEKLGVTCKYGPRMNVDLANIANEGLFKAWQAGSAMPDEVLTVSKGKKSFCAQTGFFFSTDPQGVFHVKQMIEINTAYAAMTRERFEGEVAKGWWSQWNPVIHELGHIQHATADPKAYITFSRVRNRAGLSPSDRKTAEKVSRYAATAPSEFIAELYAGLAVGKKYDQDVLDLHKTLTGKTP